MQINQQVSVIERWLGAQLSHAYRHLLVSQGGKFIGDTVRIYAADEVIERNECHEMQVCCPGFLAIGDDSGGRAIVIDPRPPTSPVCVVDQGSMSPDDFRLVSDNLADWVDLGCPLA